ncbi:MAG TPA: preprotein translocase subunit SecE [Salinivirgaceae bacterium]|nr:preprotein translocase subunit SecE [Salinivirgaceae bacterium]
MKKIREYLGLVYDEMLNKVTWPKWSELQNSTIVVMVASIIIALLIFLMDTAFSGLMRGIYSIFY